MSLVCPSREVAAGPTVGFTVFLHHPGEEKGKRMEELVVGGNRNGFCLGERNCAEEVVVVEEEEQSESSSVGEQSSLSLSSSTVEDRGDGGGEEEEEVQSKLKKDSLGSLESLEESLPIKRGLSNFFTGKSKSFATLSDAVTVKDLVKPENPFNKRRRILMACNSSWPRRASYTALGSSLPALLSPDPDEGEEEEEEGEKGGVEESSSFASLPPIGRKPKTFRSPRSFSLSDLRHA